MFTTSPVYRSLSHPVLFFGMPGRLGMPLVVMTLGIAFTLVQYWFVLVGLAAILLVRGVTKIDPYFFDAFVDSLHLPREAD